MVDLGAYSLVLASKSPRRQELLRGLGLPFGVRTMDTDESFPDHLRGAEIATYLARIKGEAFKAGLSANEIVITADTIVWLGDKVYNKPADEAEAVAMISSLSGRSHEVITGVSLLSRNRHTVFYDSTRVYFGEVSTAEIEHYVRTCRPFDKAGAYGIQEWIGYVGIEKIEGSFYNVMGFPTRKFYTELQKFLQP